MEQTTASAKRRSLPGPGFAAPALHTDSGLLKFRFAPRTGIRSFAIECRWGQSPLILQPGPAALTDGLDALHAIVERWALR